MSDERTSQQFPVTVAVRIYDNGEIAHYVRRMVFPWKPASADIIEIDPSGSIYGYIGTVCWKCLNGSENPEYLLRIELTGAGTYAEHIEALKGNGFMKVVFK